MEKAKKKVEELNDRTRIIHMHSNDVKTKLAMYEEADERMKEAGFTGPSESRGAAAQVARKQIDDLSDGVAAALAQEVQSLEERQRRQQRMQEQMQTQLASMRKLVTQLNQAMVSISDAAKNCEIANSD